MKAEFIAYVSDQAKARDFFAHVLDQVPRLDVPGMTEFDLGDGAVLGLMPTAGIHRLLGRGPASPVPFGAELYLSVDDPAAFHARALAAGAQELSPLLLRDWGDTAAYSLTPDGLVLAFASSSRA